ncbi:hypothetical protein [Streptomyces longwoodensis]|uniref:hypothetical protein n=1 Tax=Streptomyces longwoodensis TaxID=68231 RepID=UPI002251686F|nr:hypothetical protein [Streptomyces longwoodensis]MCX4993860.1 hypothetical protein [Streptomyces longwoodensis]MCX4998020.1 hypothetical protein [Streptomyces longwoodensis]
MTRPTQRVTHDLRFALTEMAQRVGERSPSVRGGDWQMAVVTLVNGDGTVAVDGIPAVRCLETYEQPAVGDVILITQSGNGNWAAWGRTSTGGIAIGQTLTARKSSSTPRASTTVMANDPHLAIAVVPGTYKVDAFLMYDGDPTADLKLGWSAPAGTTGAWWPGAMDNSGTTLTAVQRWGALSDITASTIAVGAIGAGTIIACRPVGTVIVTTAGTLALAWAQGTSSATATNLRGQSTLELRRIA